MPLFSNTHYFGTKDVRCRNLSSIGGISYEAKSKQKYQPVIIVVTMLPLLCLSMEYS